MPHSNVSPGVDLQLQVDLVANLVMAQEGGKRVVVAVAVAGPVLIIGGRKIGSSDETHGCFFFPGSTGNEL